MSISSRRGFLRDLGAIAGAAAAVSTRGTATPIALTRRQSVSSPDRLSIRTVDAYPVYINQRSEGLLDAPEFSSDNDPRRWRYNGPFAQIPSAIVAVIKTAEGITGFGMGAGGSAAVEIIHGHLRHLLVGSDPLNVEQLWDQMYSSSLFYGRRGLLPMALSAVDNALWDIVGKHAERPVHDLIEGHSRDRIAAYQTGGSVADGLARGIRHFKRSAPVGPGSSAAEMDRVVSDVLNARELLGAQGNLMTDCVSRTGTVTWALDFVERLRPANLYFMEEMLSPDDVFGYAELVSQIGGGGSARTRVACGEHEYTEHGFNVLVRLRSADILQPDITWCGGLTAGLRIARLVEGAGLEIIPHRGGSVWGIPIALTSPSCTMAETFPVGSPLLDAMTAPFDKGDYLAPTGPGFGSHLTEEMVLDHRLRA